MSFQWTFIAGYLYFEIALVMLMILPLFSPRKWYTFYRSRLFEMFHQRTAIYFYGWLGILCLFLIDSIREMRKYSHTSEPGHVHLASEMKGNVKLFRAQRNFYITGFAIFLAFVIRRLVIMIIIQYELEVKAEQIIKKAEDTVKLAKTTVMASNQQTNIQEYEEIKNKLELTESLLEVQKVRVKELEDEATMWRLKYEEVKSVDGHGDK
ncbi:B-cell receptor-associated protein 31-like [Maniola jurtina]|uniref:B-cell receptor-associated protein 31-like n=1 Tax=Maniola jurtina TaxID=191418 RepID=UPI001E68F6C5|nr:B-cell receptor-associated protein 31-like [Maniola jurtina]XP_045775867.1 B-cell receptor-associated protein 31-like [Maniola jurtina]